MTLDTYIFQIALGILLFFIINWIGKHSYSIGYMEISMFLKVEEAPALNFIFRILSPIVYLIIVSAILYQLNLDRYTKNFYLVSIYYILFRLIFNLLTNRALLMNWNRQLLYWISIITLSYFSYTLFISKKENILPDFSSISNELWLIILIFLFGTLNRVRVHSSKTKERKENYLKSRYGYIKHLFSDIINEEVKNDKLKSIIYAIIIYEDFNRPKAARLIENLSYFIRRKKCSLGIMQVHTNVFINDRTSVKLGVEKVNTAYSKALKEIGLDKKSKINKLLPDAWRIEWTLEKLIIKDYNPDDNYIDEVRDLTDHIFSSFMPKDKEYLFPGYKGEKI